MKFGGERQFSLKERFVIVFSGLLAVAVMSCSFLLWRQHQKAVQGAETAIRIQTQLVEAAQLRALLAKIDRRVREGELPSDQIERYRVLVKKSPQLSDKFEAYVSSIAHQSGEVRTSYADVLDTLESESGKINSSIYDLAERFLQGQLRFIRIALACLGLFGLGLVLASYRLIGMITRPLSRLVSFLDQVRVEDDLPESVPSFGMNVSEARSVAHSFEQLLSRLRSYRALNVSRLLVEKRRADIISASISDGIFLLRNEEVIYCSPVGERILGLPVGKSFSLRQHAGLPGAEAVLRAISRSMPVEFMVERGGRRYDYLIQAQPIDHGVIEQAETSGFDTIHERFQANLIVVAQDVTLVHEGQEAKRHFLGTLSHEVKTPVTSLTMATRLLKRDLEQFANPTHRSLISTCIDDVERLRGLLEDLLTVSRFDSLTQRMEVQTVELGKLVKHTVQNFHHLGKERGILLECKLLNLPKAQMIPVDATKVTWALSNLLTNALRHTPPGGSVGVEVELQNDEAVVRVKDTGPGIAHQRQARIFEKFNSYYDLRVARSGSVGAGLSIAREIVVAHGGKIWVSSEPGDGAEFCFTLPLKRASGAFMDEGLQQGSRGLKSQLESMKGATRGTSSSGG